MTNIAFLTSGGQIPKIGTGHVVRSINLARIMVNQLNCKVIFISDTPEIINVKAPEYHIVTYKNHENSFDGLILELKSQNLDIIIIDSYKVNRHLLKSIAKLNIILIGIDNSQRIITNLFTFRVNSLIRKSKAELFGFKYLALNERLGLIPIIKDHSLPIKKIFVAFGGFDANNLTYKFVKAVSELDNLFASNYEFNLVVSQSFKKSIDIQEIISTSSNIRILIEPDNYYEVLGSSDLAVVAGGITMFEAVFLGIPTFVFSQYRHQSRNAKLLSDKKAIIFLGTGKKKNIKTGVDNIFRVVSSIDKLEELRKYSRIAIPQNGIFRLSKVLSIFEFLEWDSIFFKQRIARINVELLNDKVFSFIQNKCNIYQIKVLFFTSKKKDYGSALYAESKGFKYIDDKLTYCKEISPSNLPIKLINNNFAGINDKKSLFDISKDSFYHSRFFQDIKFEKELSQSYYENWIEKSIMGQFDDLVLIVWRDKKIAGFISCRRQSNTIGLIGLICVSEKYRMSGVGGELLHLANAWFRSQGLLLMEIVTQGRNLGARKLLEKHNFALKEVECWYHKWYE